MIYTTWRLAILAGQDGISTEMCEGQYLYQGKNSTFSHPFWHILHAKHEECPSNSQLENTLTAFLYCFCK